METNANVTPNAGEPTQAISQAQPTQNIETAAIPEPPAKVEKTFTQAELNRIAAKEAKEAETALLKSLGLKSKDELTSLTEDFNAYREAKKNAETDSDKLKREITDHAATRAELDTLKARIAQYEHNKILTEITGETDDFQLNILRNTVLAYVTEDTDFSTVAVDKLKNYKPAKKQEEQAGENAKNVQNALSFAGRPKNSVAPKSGIDIEGIFAAREKQKRR